MAGAQESIHEVDFCSRIASDAEQIFASNRDFFPFSQVRVEGFGSGSARSKRKDLRFYEPNDKLAICGEVKLPGTSEGRSPFESEVVADAYRKAENANVQYFFTWNVNEFVLWDRSRWDVPLLERRVKVWKLGLNLSNPADVARPEALEYIRTKFLPDLLRDLADIYTGRRRDWELPPDDIFLRSLESHLDWPVQLLRQYLFANSQSNKAFNARLELWLASQDRPFIRGIPEEWRAALDAASRSLAYVWANRIIFYKALRSRFPQLPRLELKAQVKTAAQAEAAFDILFRRAVEVSGDYEPLLFPGVRDWATQLVFDSDGAIDAWRALLRGIESIDFKQVRSDVVGRIFQKLISPEERHRFGQHFTGDDAVDLINAFCIRNAADAVLDPACGSGSFLVRAYYRKKRLDPTRTHDQLLAELFGCDIALYPAHLATLNLAAREINEEANYPRIARRDFFDTGPGNPFVELPDGRGGHLGVALPQLDAVVGNPPYVRQEKVEKSDKARFAALISEAWKGDLVLSGRADLHCYFWPVATRLLKSDGYFGFLTSSSWLDVEYGFALQGWILRHFKLIAIMESADEPWFTDARVKTCITILQRCDDERERMGNRVRFVKFRRPLAQIIEIPTGDDEPRRQRAVEKLARRIESAGTDVLDDDMRLILKPQQELWNQGVRAARVLERSSAEVEADDDEDADAPSPPVDNGGHLSNHHAVSEYRAGKWGRYVRAPDFYFRIMRDLAAHFVPLGELVSVRRGITSGCDAFFMPKDVSRRMLADFTTDVEFRQRTGTDRHAVEQGTLKIVKDGAGVVHPIEARYVAPELHSLMNVDRPVVRAKTLDRVVLLVRERLNALKGTWVHRYLQYGKEATFLSKKSKSVPVPQRTTCAARDPWYDLTDLARPGFAFWPMAQQYRHIIPANPESVICNHNLFDLASDRLKHREKIALVAVLNSTLVGLFKTFYGRYAGTEGNLKTEVVDVNLIEVPDVRGIKKQIADKLAAALKSMQRREVGRLVEEQLMECHSPERARKIAAGPMVISDELRQEDRAALDDAVFELLGVTKAAQRKQLVQALHEETALHFRAIRVVEIQKMRQRSTTAERRLNVQDLAADCWDAAGLDDARPLVEWIQSQPGATRAVNIPEERPAILSPSPMFDPNTVYFGNERLKTRDYASRGQAELVTRLANLGVEGPITVPEEPDSCFKLLDALEHRVRKARERFVVTASSRVGSNEKLQEQVVELLLRWFVGGRAPSVFS
jgi:methylase of polypeptide subunit release factors